MKRTYEAVPQELRESKRWCVFVIQEVNGRMTKVPYDVNTFKKARSNDESTWGTFEQALHVYNTSKTPDGLGYFFEEPYFGIDLDDVGEQIEEYRNGTADHTNIVAEFIDVMQSYAEVSPSGKGIHIIAKGKLPTQGRRKGNVECYSSGRFFTVTGDIIGEYTHVRDDSEDNKFGFLHTKYLTSGKTEFKPNVPDKTGNSLSKQNIIDAALASKNGVRFNVFMNGGWEAFYNSQSEADMAFMNDLAFWTNRNADMMDDIYRDSSMYREKWDRKTGDSTYGDLTIHAAIRDCASVFNPPSVSEDFNVYIKQDAIKKVEHKSFPYDDTGNALRFVNYWGDNVLYSHKRKQWFVYNGKYWESDDLDQSRVLVDETLKLMKKEPIITSDDIDEEEARKLFQRHIKYSRGTNGKTNMLRESQHLKAFDINDFDKDKHLLNVSNGYVDLTTGVLYTHERERYFSKHTPIEYTDTIDAPQWMAFLDQIFNHDKELIGYMQRAVGYSLSGSTQEQMLFILYGNGRNGKSVFLDIITELMGDYTENIQPQTIMVKHQSGGAATPDIAKLAGARFVTTTEPNDGMRFDEGLVKQLTGGDEVTARFLNENEFSFKPQFKLWLASNHKPIVRGTDDGIWRRICIVPFSVQIPEDEIDYQLTEKLKGELTGILNWAVEGYLIWKQYGLLEPDVIKEQRGNYRKEMDAIAQFLDECCTLQEGEREKASDLYKAYKSWANENGQHVHTSTRFGIELSNRFRKVKNSVIFYEGVKLETEHTQFHVYY